MKMHYVMLIGFLGLNTLNPNKIQAQNNPLSPLKQLQGDWQGKGWIKMPASKTIQFNQEENIKFKLDDQVLLINGKGFNQESGNLEYESLAMIYADENGELKMTSHTNDNKHAEADVEVTNSTLSWSFAIPNGGTIKYEITFSETNWKEKASYSPNGTEWYPFMEVILNKQ